MNASDVIGWIVNGTYYCDACKPSNADTEEDSAPIFGDSETDSFSHCAECEELIPECLTSDGVEHVIEAFEDFLTFRRGRPEILRDWADALACYGLEPREKTIRDLVFDATSDAALKSAKRAAPSWKTSPDEG